MQNPRFEDAFYKNYYEELYRDIAFGDLAPSERYIEQQAERGDGVRLWVKANNINSPGKVLDHGCASGATMKSWEDSGWECSGIDPHRPSVQLGCKLGFNVTEASGESLPFRENYFNLVLSLGSLEHVYDLEKSMDEIYRVLIEDGHLIIRWRTNKIFGSPLEYYNHNHYRFFTPNTLRLLLKKHGFIVNSTTEKKLEGWDSYEYLIAQKKLGSAQKYIDWSCGDDAHAELNGLIEIRNKYYKRCKQFVALHREFNGDAVKIIAAIQDESRKFYWGFLGGDDSERVKRSFDEAKQYIECYESQKVN